MHVQPAEMEKCFPVYNTKVSCAKRSFSIQQMVPTLQAMQHESFKEEVENFLFRILHSFVPQYNTHKQGFSFTVTIYEIGSK